jgi:hypothetical protein
MLECQRAHFAARIGMTIDQSKQVSQLIETEAQFAAAPDERQTFEVICGVAEGSTPAERGQDGQCRYFRSGSSRRLLMRAQQMPSGPITARDNITAR